MTQAISWTAVAAACVLSSPAALAAEAVPSSLPAYDHIVIVVLENHSADAGGAERVWGNPAMPFLNGLATDPRYAARFSNAWASETPYRRIPAGWDAPLPARPSQPNYLYLFSGSHQGVRPEWFKDPASPYRGRAEVGPMGDKADGSSGDNVGIGNRLVPMAMRPFITANLGAAVREAGKRFLSFSESLPYPTWDGTGDPLPTQDDYRRKHNPAINWIELGNRFTQRSIPTDRRRFLLPPDVNLGFQRTVDPQGQRWRGFVEDANGQPLGFDQLPHVALLVPNEQHDAHSAPLSHADTWLRDHIGPYATWASTHNSLLIVTFDEDGATDTRRGDGYRWGRDRIATFFYGAGVKPGVYDERIDALNVLATVLHSQGLLTRFRTDFAATCPEDKATCARELANLRPVLDVFGAGAALRELPPTRD